MRIRGSVRFMPEHENPQESEEEVPFGCGTVGFLLTLLILTPLFFLYSAINCAEEEMPKVNKRVRRQVRRNFAKALALFFILIPLMPPELATFYLVSSLLFVPPAIYFFITRQPR